VGVFFSRTSGLIRVEGKLNTTTYKHILNENLVQKTQDFRPSQRFNFIFQQDNMTQAHSQDKE